MEPSRPQSFTFLVHFLPGILVVPGEQFVLFFFLMLALPASSLARKLTCFADTLRLQFHPLWACCLCSHALSFSSYALFSLNDHDVVLLSPLSSVLFHRYLMLTLPICRTPLLLLEDMTSSSSFTSGSSSSFSTTPFAKRSKSP